MISKNYRLDIPTNFRTKEWAENELISGFYKYFSNKDNINTTNRIEVDFCKCIWIDPWPIMSLITFFAHHIIPYSKEVLFIFPKPQIIVPLFGGDVMIDQNKVLRFLLKEGFLSILNDLKVKTNLGQEDIRLIDDFGDILSYSDCHLCESKLINTCSDNIEDVIDEIIQKTAVNLQKRKLSSLYINNLSYKARVFLTETLDNVTQHAYEEDNNYKYAMVYVRYRYGAQNIFLNSSQKQILRASIEKEEKNHPSVVFSQDCFDEKPGFLEIFVVDVGIGISEAVGLKKLGITWPSRKAFYNVITEDRNRSGKTLVGGLKLIGKILDRNRILSKDREEWLGCNLPLTETSNYYEVILPGIKEKYHIRGCYWLARISWDSVFNIDSSIWKKATSENIENLQVVYRNERSSKILDDYVFIDERFNPFFYDWNKRNNHYKEKLKVPKSITIYFSPENTQKHLIHENILQLIIKNLSSETNLIIVDINIRETETYISALHKADLAISKDKAYEQKIFFLPRIFLVTKNLDCCVLTLEKDRKQYVINDNATIQFLNGEEDAKEISLAKILRAMITKDSFTIWQDVFSLKKLHTFINSRILWDTESNKYISGYLDFNQLCTVPIFTQLFEIGVFRFIGTFSDINKVEIQAIDPLVKNTVNNIKSKIPYDQDSNSIQTVKIGSVLVLGYTQNERDNVDNSWITVHCFLHPDSDPNKQSIYRLFVWPQKGWIKKFYTPPVDDFYQRLGRTHAITPNGWKFYKIPRYDEKENSLYFRDPPHSYKDWQFENIGLRIGNYEYDGYYELFKLDIKYVIDAAFTYYTDLAVFLFVNFFLALGGHREDQIQDPIMRTKCQKILNQILSDKEARKFYEKVVLIVYPSHYYTNIVIDKLSYLLDKKFFESKENPLFIDKIIPLNFIRPSNSNSSGLISPLTFDEITQLVEKTKGEKNIILFDDSIVNGRTRKEIKHLLLNQFHDINEVRTLSIIDRFRLPYDIPNPLKHKSYWRLDVPRLGINKYNPITAAIAKAIDESKNFTPTAKEIVRRWEKGWRKRNAFRDDPFHGVVAEKITLEKPYKKFGLKYDISRKTYIQAGNDGSVGNKKNYIKIENSIGASIYAIETYCLTGRDDIAYSFVIKGPEEVPNKAKIHIICSFLLLFGPELRLTIKKLMIEKLIDIINNDTSITESDNENALASLTIIDQAKETIKTVFEAACLQHKIFHEDLIVAFAVALPNEIVQEQKFLKRIFLDNTFDKDWNDRNTLHQELFEEGSAHENTFRRFIEQRNGACSQKDLIFCLEQFYNICENLNPYLFEELLPQNEVLQNINNCMQLLKEQNNESKENPQLRKILSSLDNLLLGVHSNIFYQLSDRFPKKITITKDNFFINKVLNSLNWDKVAKEKNVCMGEYINPLVFHTNNLTNIIGILNSINSSYWVPFEKNIMSHFKNIISNVMNGSYQLIKSPFGNSIRQEAHLWYNTELDLEKLSFTLTFANQVKDGDINKHVRRANNSRKKEKYYSERLQCKTEYYANPIHEKILFCKVTLPILK
jgi:hypothetical protein